MAKLDRLGWATGMSFSSYGVRFGIRANEPRILEQTLAHMPPQWKPSSTMKVEHLYSLVAGGKSTQKRVRRYNLLYSGPFRLARTMKVEELFECFESDLQVLIAEMARSRLFVHAGVVGWKGRAIVIPGKSMSGKTTLVANLVQAGATYYSDEYALFDAQGRVHPYPRPLQMREKIDGQARRTAVEVPEPKRGRKPLPVGLVAVTNYQEGREWRPRVLTEGQAVLELMRHTVAARSRPKHALAALRNVVSTALSLKSARGQTTGVVDKLLNDVENP